MFYLGFGPDVSDIKTLNGCPKILRTKLMHHQYVLFFLYSIVVDLQDQILLTSF